MRWGQNLLYDLGCWLVRRFGGERIRAYEPPRAPAFGEYVTKCRRCNRKLSIPFLPELHDDPDEFVRHMESKRWFCPECTADLEKFRGNVRAEG